MMIKSIYGVIILLILTGCKNESKEKNNKVYYRNFFTEQRLEEIEYKNLKDSLSLEFELNELIISKKNKNDSVIISYELLRSQKGIIDGLRNAKKLIGKTIPIDSLKTMDGKPISLMNIINNNKPTLLNFWYTSCAPCIEEMPELNKLKQDYGEKVNFISITFSSKQKVESLLKKHPFNFLHTLDAKRQIKVTVKNKVFPLNVFINKDGIVSYVTGNSYGGGKLFRELLDNLL